MQRRVEPEILDTLPPDDPEAIRSRRDLRRINAIMGNYRWLLRRIREVWQPGWRVLELGAGDGSFGQPLVEKAGLVADLLHGADLAPRPDCWPAGAHWYRGDILKEALPAAEIVIANLFLHHFEGEGLACLGARLPAECRVFFASEPSRRRLHLWQGRLLNPLLALSRVTRHDMPVSIRAGFCGDELPQALGLHGWKIAVSATFFGAYRMETYRP